jgi:lysophospholipase L1-like esterase
MVFSNNNLILFQGDSITDCGRSRTEATSLGNGYAMMAAAWLSAAHPGAGWRFLNRGISGNRAKDLRARWQTDCLDLKPDWVSILIGINDTWRRFDRSDPTTTEAYEADYRFILQQTKDSGARLIICEPFLLPIPQDRVAWRADLDPKIAVARKLAREFAAVYVPLDGAFAAAATQQPMEAWAPDGVHPTPAGHALIAQTWLHAVQAGSCS